MAETDVDDFGFKRFDGDFIFVACSGDLTPERIAVERAVKDEIKELGQDHVRVYSWDTQIGPGGLDQRRSMQRNIPRPSADNCLGMIYIVGERIGLPLEQGFDPVYLGESQSWIDDTPHSLTLDWPDDVEEARKLLRNGAFPLTGGVFEFLAARGHKDAEYESGKPVYMAVLANSEVRPAGGDITLNWNRWHYEETKRKTPAQRRTWEKTVYADQVTGVHNFLRACALQGIAQNPTSECDQLVPRVRDFVRRSVFGQQAESVNPYRELRYFDVQHGHFYGRRDYIKRVIRRLEERLADPDRPTACRITGPSGTGKSSVLRAGILRELDDPAQRGRYAWAAFRPELFKDQMGADMGVLDTLLDEIETQGGIELAGKVRRDISRAGANAPTEAVKAVMGELKRANVEAEWLILALDQFEEIVDELVSTRRREYWQPLLRFFEVASTYPEFGMIYTLESSRADQHERLKLPEPFKSAEKEELDEATGSFVEDVIRLPFAKTGYPLADDVICELAKQFAKLRDEETRAARNSVLPLLALKLHALWDFTAANFESADNIIGGEANLGPHDEKIGMEQLTAQGQKFDFASVIDKQATKAWRRAGAGQVEDDKLGYFMQPFVGVEGDYVQLTAAPRQAPYADEQKLIESFRQHRLLVDVGDGLVRLVHQAVLDHWQKASDWLDQNRSFLEREAALRIEAADWDKKGRKRITFRGKNLERKIAIAAEVLATYRRSWSLGEENAHSGDRSLRDYSIALFKRSSNPFHLVKPCTKTSQTYMHYAAAYGLIDLLNRFVDTDSSCVDSFTSADENDARRPLDTAAWAHPRAVKFLLKCGANPVAKTSKGWPAAASTIQMGRMDIFETLMDAAKTWSKGRDLEQLLLCPHEYTLVHMVAWFDQPEMLRELLDRYGFSPCLTDQSGCMPIHHASREGALAVFDLLRERCGIDVRVKEAELTCLHLAAANGQEKMVDKILSLPDGWDLLDKKDSQGWTALHHAAYGKHADCITALLKSGLDPNQPTKLGETALRLVLQGVPDGSKYSGNADFDEEKTIAALRALLADKRTDLNAENNYGQLPLALVEKNRPLLRELLKDPRVDLQKPVSKDGDLGIFLAARENIWSAVQRYITEFGLPEGSETDGQGNTFLHHLTARTAPRDLFYEKVGEVPRDHLNARNKKGQTPFHRAFIAKNWPLAERMLETGLLDLHNDADVLNWEIRIGLKVGAPMSLIKKLAKTLGPRITEPDSDGWTILHHLAAMNYARWPETLAKAAPLDNAWNVSDRQGRRPIDLGGKCIDSMIPKELVPTNWPEPIAWDQGVDWTVVTKTKMRAFIKKAEAEDVDTENWEMSRGTLPFYPGTSIARLKHRANGKVRPVYYYLEDGKKIFRLNGTSPPIHEFNAPCLKLERDCVRNYLHFFNFFVRGEEGPFFILEDPSLPILSPEITDEDRSNIAELAMPSWLIGQREENFRLLARVYYSNALYTAYFKVLKTGMIEMEDDVPVLADLSGKVNMPVA